jgi:uncharacterized membrane protein
MARRWLLAVNGALAVLVGLPWLAPVLMHLGWDVPAGLIYTVYSLLCHQLPERSWFLFGPSLTPTLAQIDAVSGAGANFFALRHFIGNAEMGWKLAWSDRMVSLFGGLFLFGVVYAVVRRVRPGWRGLSWGTAALLALPMFVDGLTHAISDAWGVGQGFRDSNVWLALLTGSQLPAAFYAGDAWGSLNSVARLVTGVLAAAGVGLWVLPRIDASVRAMSEAGRTTRQGTAAPFAAEVGP